MKKRNQQSCCFAELALRSLVVCVLKEDLSYQLTKMTRTQTSHSTYTHATSKPVSRKGDGWRREREREEELARRIKYSNKISREHSRGGMSVCIWRCAEQTNWDEYMNISASSSSDGISRNQWLPFTCTATWAALPLKESPHSPPPPPPPHPTPHTTYTHTHTLNKLLCNKRKAITSDNNAAPANPLWMKYPKEK